jgi:AmmeMemoRadiSam system protein B
MRHLAFAVFAAWVAASFGQQPPALAVPSREGLRGLVDTKGYSNTAVQMDAVGARCEKIASEGAESPTGGGLPRAWTAWVASICPHDDHVYAGPVYVPALKGLKAKTVVVFGVCHKAKALGLRDRLVFDDFERWCGRYGPVPVSSLREEIMKRLPGEDWVVSRDAHAAEWSVEGIVPWLQYYERDVTLLPVLVPHMDWERTRVLSGDLGKALAQVVRDKGLKLGEDLAFVMSGDGVHYGDQPEGWDYAPFGCGVEGYLKAVAQDHLLSRDTLEGTVDEGKVRRLAESLVDQSDVFRYKVTWCGRFSVTLGLATLDALTRQIGRTPLEGKLEGYGTSVGLGLQPFDKVGLGPTAPANLHHWVSYLAVVYR